MSESLLFSLIELIAIVAKFRKDRDRVHHVVEFFLKSQLGIQNARKYEEYFQKEWLAKTELNETEYQVSESAKAVKVCAALNRELTQQQKLSVLIVMFSTVEDERSIGETELEFIREISEMFNIDEETFFLCVSFNLLSLSNDLASQGSLVAFSNHQGSLKRDKRIDLHGQTGSIAILRVDSTNSYFVKHMSDESITINDVPMLDRVVYDYTFGDVIRLGNGEPLHFSDIAAELSTEKGKILFEADQVTYVYPNGKTGLHELSFSETSGRLIGLMGASGAGKSTLMQVLNGNLVPKTGRVLINGVDVHTEKDRLIGIIGYVPQDDLLIEDLTVFQNLYFAARLGFANKTPSETADIVKGVISDLGLSAIMNNKVGSALKNSISGGQRKRVNIGLELLRAPNVLFLDEPTSGLSSKDSQTIMEMLKRLSLAGKLVFVVIHQPSPEIFKLFDRLLIMDTGGYPIYYGNPLDAITYFKGKTNRLNKDIIYDGGRLNPEIIFELIESKTLTEFGKHTGSRRTKPVEWYHEFQKKFVAFKKEFTGGRLETVHPAVWLSQLKTFLTRDALSKLSNRQYMTINLLQAPILAIFLTLLSRHYDAWIGNDHYTFSGNENLPVFLFISIIVALFMGLTISAEEIVHDRKILRREKFLSLSRSSYLISKVLILFAMTAFQTLSFWTVSVWVMKINHFDPVHLGILFSAGAFANLLGLNISSMFNRAITAYILIPILLIPQLVLGGIVLQFDKINPDIKSGPGVPFASELMASRWAYEGMMTSFFMDNDYNRGLFNVKMERHQADHQAVYRAASLEAKLEHAIQYMGTRELARLFEMDRNLKLVRSELSKKDDFQFAKVSDVRIESGSALLKEAKEHVKEVKSNWLKKSELASNRESDLIAAMSVVHNGDSGLNEFRQANHNEAIEKFVRDSDSEHRIIEKENRLIILADPIYREPDGDRLFSISHLFSPYKYLLGMKVSTPVFNIIVIWLMTFCLYVSLYFNWLKRINSWFNRRVWLQFVNIIFSKREKL